MIGYVRDVTSGRYGRGLPGRVAGPDGDAPRLKPEIFYDLACEVALIRPGPIQGGSVHPYIRRRNGTEKITYPHPLLKKVWNGRLG